MEGFTFTTLRIRQMHRKATKKKTAADQLPPHLPTSDPLAEYYFSVLWYHDSLCRNQFGHVAETSWTKPQPPDHNNSINNTITS